ncbi:unnamed protein product [Symbiodinium sp. CCMP2592]|nr:unnamed protein product [Symbiodinium sp. CCMP2592]
MASDRKAENDGSVDEDLDGEAPAAAIGDLSETLKQVKAETETELAATQVAEEKSRKNFAELTKTMEEEVATRQAAVDEVKAAISTSEEAAGKAKSDLLSVNRRLSSTKQQLTELQVDLKDKSKDFATRGKSRDAEAGVVAEALAILTKSSSGATVEESAKTLASFLQLSSEAWGSHHSSRERELSRRKVARLLESAASPGLAALLLQSQEGSGRRDVFKKVKALIHEMLAKMNEQQAQDARRDSWCQTELSNTNNAKASKATRADKLKTKMLAVTAELSSLKSEIETSAKEIDDMKASMGKAESQRGKESAKAKADVVMYEEDQRVLREAILVLQRVYGDTSVKADNSGYKAKATGSGVVGLLQVSLENFADLAEETAKGEKEAKADFQELKTTTEVRLATFVKDTEYKKQTITKLESELVRANEDLASYQKEIKALSTYLEELATSCSVKGLSFEERKAKREEQLASLKEAGILPELLQLVLLGEALRVLQSEDCIPSKATSGNVSFEFNRRELGLLDVAASACEYPKLPLVQTSWKPGTEQNLASMQAQRTVDSLLRHEPCDRDLLGLIVDFHTSVFVFPPSLSYAAKPSRFCGIARVALCWTQAFDSDFGLFFTSQAPAPFHQDYLEDLEREAGLSTSGLLGQGWRRQGRRPGLGFWFSVLCGLDPGECRDSVSLDGELFRMLFGSFDPAIPDCGGYFPEDDHMAVDVVNCAAVDPAAPSQRGANPVTYASASICLPGPGGSSMAATSLPLNLSARAAHAALVLPSSSPMATSPCQADKPEQSEGPSDARKAWKAQIQERAREELRKYRLALQSCEAGVNIRPCG